MDDIYLLTEMSFFLFVTSLYNSVVVCRGMDAEELSRPGGRRDHLAEISRYVFDGHTTAQDSVLSDCL